MPIKCLVDDRRIRTTMFSLQLVGFIDHDKVIAFLYSDRELSCMACQVAFCQRWPLYVHYNEEAAVLIKNGLGLSVWTIAKDADNEPWVMNPVFLAFWN